MLLVQVEFLATANPSKLTATRVSSVVDGDEIFGQFNFGLELDAGHLAGDVRHRLQDGLLVLDWEGVVELVLHHTSRPETVRVGMRGVVNFLASIGAVSDDNVAFDC